ncbi:uncharacterized protein LOC130648212 [Hydractinia symbiolongicarpus]|uniref:uncharacterized protein LOC130648212 n=1 Tax=Hydractinia symbiolongicarpus TaxID=13093 RepID=UPI00254AC895|nr:uncharacterized protein LOC130648212 [Hydractinia symbiolongicarpus]
MYIYYPLYLRNPTCYDLSYIIAYQQVTTLSQLLISSLYSYFYLFKMFLFLSSYLPFFCIFAKCRTVENAPSQHKQEKLLLQLTIKALLNKVNILNRLNKQLEEKVKNCTCKKPVNELLLNSDEDVMFYTGITSRILFDKLCSYITPYVKRKWRGLKETNITLVRKYKRTPNKSGAKSKLCVKDEFLLMLMKIRLGLLGQDLAQRFGISATISSRIFATWVKATAGVLKSFVYFPDYGHIAATRPPRFRDVQNLHSIADGTEIFIQTPKNHIAQRQTWSSYKHHNTAKILVVVLPNSHIEFISKAYSGCISDKELTMQSGYLDFVEPYTDVMVDKGFNIADECAARCINIIVPPGKRGQSQMTQADVRKTTKIAKLRILVEQVISRLKKFHLIAKEVPITLLCHLDDIIIICAALCNLKKPIYGK